MNIEVSGGATLPSGDALANPHFNFFTYTLCFLHFKPIHIIYFFASATLYLNHPHFTHLRILTSL